MVRAPDNPVGSEPVIMLATDLEGGTAAGLRVASRLAVERSATLLIAHVVPLRASDGEGMLQTAAAMGTGAPRTRLHRLVPPDPSVPYFRALRVGEPEDELARLAARWAVELVILERRPRSAWRRALSPGLLDRLQERLSCPIVTYRDDAISAPPPPALAPPTLEPLVMLRVMLDTRIHALLDLLDARGYTATQIAERDTVRHGVASLGRASRWFARRIEAELELELAEHTKAIRAVGMGLWLDPWTGAPSIAVGSSPCAPGPALIARALQTGCAVSLPMASELPGRRLVVVAAARVAAGGRPAVLAITFDARRGFLRILGHPGPSASSETYAFDSQGTMLSNSRFPHQLRRAGLLAPSARAPGSVRVCDPGCDLTESRARRDAAVWPLTQMAASAIAGNDGEARGYRDYRGVPVVGVWRWIPAHGFGVAAEMDVADARLQRARAIGGHVAP